MRQTATMSPGRNVGTARAVWCPVLSQHSACPNEASTSFSRLSEPSPVQRLCRATSHCSRSHRDCLRRCPEISGSRPNTSCVGETPETDNRLFLASCSVEQALSPLLLRLWLHLCSERLQHELKQLGMVFNFALWFLRSSTSPPLRCLAVRTNS